ncbi:MAG: hypothetical protein ACRCXB_03360 [Aeromonadaceae bacterium]
MKEYLHMDDVFDLRLMDACKLSVKPSCVWSAWDDGVTPHEYAAHAINSHDELVENMNHYKSEAEMWEGRAVREASAHADMIIEREGLLEEIERLRKAVDEVNEQLHDAIMDRKFQQ